MIHRETRKYLQRIGIKGGLIRSAKKARASRKNGKKGGRPKKCYDAVK